LRNSLDLARRVEALGYQRYWMAEHHNLPGIASAAATREDSDRPSPGRRQREENRHLPLSPPDRCNAATPRHRVGRPLLPA
jgi:hypothetical protein